MVGDQLHQVAQRSPRGRRPVADQSATSPRSVADQLQNLVATPLRPLRSFWILFADRSQSGSSVCPRELQLNKANTSDKETSFLDLKIKVIGNDIHTSVYDKRDDFGFTIVNFLWLSGDVPRLPSYGIYISQ